MTTTTWPGWESVRRIGAGSFGQVYEIKRTIGRAEEHSALKVITIPQDQSDAVDLAMDYALDEQSIDEYYRKQADSVLEEIAIMAQLKGHESLVSYEDFAIEKNSEGAGFNVLIRMELLTPLRVRMLKNPLSETEVIDLGIAMSEALALCHGKDILHRDIKPENIFVNDYDKFKLGDFGVSRKMESTVATMSTKGTYTYMAPEIKSGKRYGATADIYSLGLVLYKYLNNNLMPFEPAGDIISPMAREAALAKRFEGQQIPAPANGSDQLKEVVLKAIAYGPEDRYQNAKEMQQDLILCLDKSPEPASKQLENMRPLEIQPINNPVTEEAVDETEVEATVLEDAKAVAQVVRAEIKIQPEIVEELPPELEEKRKTGITLREAYIGANNNNRRPQ